MDWTHVEITGARETGLVLEEFPDALYDDLRNEIGGLLEELHERVVVAAPDVTGTLRSEIDGILFADKNRIVGYVSVNGPKGSKEFAKAGALEYGAHRPTSVKAHAMRLDHAWSEKLAAPETVLVAAYTRTPDIEEHNFLRGPLDAMRPEVDERLNAVVERRVVEANA